MLANHPSARATPTTPVRPPVRATRVSRRARAFHEAGHAVAAMWFGNILGRRVGVTVRARHRKGDTHRVFSTLGRCNVIWNPWITTETAQASVSLAGPLAQYQGVGGTYDYGDDDEVWDTCANVIDFFPDAPPVEDDLSQCAFAICRWGGALDAEELIGIVRDHEAATRELLTRPVIWDSITRVADALLQQYTLSHQQVFDLVGADIMHGAHRQDQ